MGMAVRALRRRIRRASAVTVWLLWTVVASAANVDEGGRDARVRLTFGVDVPQLKGDAAIRRWVATDLRRRLGFDGTDVLTVEPARPLGDYRIVRLSQTIHGVPVLYRESRLLLNGDDAPVRLLGYHSPFPDTPVPHPRLTPVEAVSIAGGREHDTPSSRLVFLPAGGHVRLSFELEGEFPDTPRPAAPFERVYVDASTGQVIERLSLRRRALDRRIRDFALACREREVPGPVYRVQFRDLRERSPIVRSETVNTGDRSAERLFDLLGSIYSFFDLILARDSFDGAGAPIVAFLGVRYQADMEWPQCDGDVFLAEWDPRESHMLLPVEALNYPGVLAHEYTHGVVNEGSGLTYARQSGALDEAISDALGVTFAAWLGAGAPGDENVRFTMTPRDWQLRNPGGVMRDLRDPGSTSTQFGPNPDHYGDYMHVLADYGGVHINSSIVNQGFYLLAEGGPHPRRRGEGPVVDGIGTMRAARIFAAAAAEGVLTSNADFEDARYAFAAVAEELYGIGSREWIAVHTAMDAVGVPGRWAPPPEREGSVPENNTVLLFSLIAAISLLGAAGLMLRLRPARSVAARRTWSSGRRNPAPNVGVAPVPAPTSPPAPHGEALLGTLRPADDSKPIPLPETLLSSREGMVIGRNLEMCHVEIQHSAVSRRHVRLRASRGTVLVEDLNSLEGTQVDGVDLKPFEPQSIASGQTLGIGGAAFRFQRKVKFRFRP